MRGGRRGLGGAHRGGLLGWLGKEDWLGLDYVVVSGGKGYIFCFWSKGENED